MSAPTVRDLSRQRYAFRRLTLVAHSYAHDRGFWSSIPLCDIADGEDAPLIGKEIGRDTREMLGYRLALIAGEAHEAVDALRKNEDWRDAVADELADVLLRVFDFAGATGIDMDEAVRRVRERSEARPHMHGKHA